MAIGPVLRPGRLYPQFTIPVHHERRDREGCGGVRYGACPCWRGCRLTRLRPRPLDGAGLATSFGPAAARPQRRLRHAGLRRRHTGSGIGTGTQLNHDSPAQPARPGTCGGIAGLARAGGPIRARPRPVVVRGSRTWSGSSRCSSPLWPRASLYSSVSISPSNGPPPTCFDPTGTHRQRTLLPSPLSPPAAPGPPRHRAW